ncbi:hypothetical protein BDN71DRAFT_644096 [Pleurotus eryngii]|uniref:RING-type domain-containing protein n=1 Tax=Pleurotus eryngii TaxID=5323 RepID=A0A9P6A053_PLEER|nr:hypothetical protein BDN71DRAFT_644096 [Pleurotus eryngii]
MPKASKPMATTSRPTTRRSTRNSQKSSTSAVAGKSDVYVELPERASKRRRVAEDVPTVSDTSRPCSSEMKASKLATGATALRRSQRAAPGDVANREEVLTRREQELKQRTDEMEKRIRWLQQKEDQVASMAQCIEEREAKAALAMLEEHFTCPLCYEIMAHPYTLNPGQCGHTFCSLCIIKWFFSRLHRACGGWHESVDCPICRSLLVITPEHTPRLDVTFPFVPNRTADSVVKSLVEKVSHMDPSGSGSVIKTEERELSWGAASHSKKAQTKEEDDSDADSGISAWRQGLSYVEWLKRDREGRKEMNHLASNWTTLKTEYFIELKRRLGV